MTSLAGSAPSGRLRLDQPTPVIQPLVEARFGRLVQNLPRVPGRGSRGIRPAAYLSAAPWRRISAGGSRPGGAVMPPGLASVLAAYGWVSFGEEFVGELGLHLKLLPGEAYIWDCVTVPAFRQKHLYSALLGYILGPAAARTALPGLDRRRPG